MDFACRAYSEARGFKSGTGNIRILSQGYTVAHFRHSRRKQRDACWHRRADHQGLRLRRVHRIPFRGDDYDINAGSIDIDVIYTANATAESTQPSSGIDLSLFTANENYAYAEVRPRPTPASVC